MTRLLLTVAAMALVTLFTRAAPFLFFAKRRPPASMDYLQAYLPPALMTILVLSAFKSLDLTDPLASLPAAAGVAATAILHVWKRNVLLSIGAGTAVYMALLRVMA